MRTLVLSDLHLGVGPRHAAVELPRPRERLLAALEGVERLVLLGDVLELLERTPGHTLQIAEPILRSVGGALRPGAEVIFVPGNHDRLLIQGWLRARREPLEPSTAVPADASPALTRVIGWLGPARVEVRYPGVWLADGMWATHGHYLDRHLFPDSSWGVGRGRLARLPRDLALPDDYEPRAAERVARLRSRLPEVLREPIGDLLDLARAATMPPSPGRLLSPRLAPLVSAVLGVQMQRASIPALARVVHRLGVRADTVLFGHVHRLGPLRADDRADWRDPSGHMAIYNCGSWVYEPLLLHRASPPHPYWPGGALVLSEGRPPQPVGLLDDLGAADVHRAGPRRRRRTR